MEAARADGIDLTITDSYRNYDQQVDLAGPVVFLLGSEREGLPEELIAQSTSVATIALPAQTAADVDISTVNGSINTEFPMTITGRWGPKT